MKRFLVLISVLLVLCLAFAGCGEADTAQSSTQSSLEGSASTGGAGQSPDSSQTSTDSGTVNGGTEDNGSGETDQSSIGTQDSEVTDKSESGTADSGAADSGTQDSEATDEGTDSSESQGGGDVNTDKSEGGTVSSEAGGGSTDEKPEEIPEPDVPDGPIDIAINGLSSYVVVYEADNIRVQEFAQKFVDYMSKTHKITLEAVEYSEELEHELCIYIGNVKETRRIRARMNSANDFGACVSGNDYVLCATNDRLYEYLYDLLLEKVLYTIRGGNWSTKPQKDFIYSQSDYKDLAYVDYLMQSGKYGTGVNKQYLLPKIFEDRSYTASDGTTIPYRLYVPYDYDESREYPVVILLHGANDRGTDNLSSMNGMVADLFSHENSEFWNSIMIIPQCPWENQWVDTPWEEGGYRVDEVPESNENKAVVEILGFVGEEFPTDRDRYYVTGLSMGGFGTWDLIMRHPELFAAAVPLCGGGDYKQAYKLVDMPIYAVHDIRDYSVPFSGTKEMIVALEILGSTVIRYEETMGRGHDVWSYAADKAEIWTWLFEQTREGR